MMLAADRDDRLSDPQVRYLELDPGRSLLVLWRIRRDGMPAEIVLSRGRLDRSDGRAEDPGIVEIGDPPTVVAWFPSDPGLPLLRDGLAAAARGLHLPADAKPQVLAWVPQQRATVRMGDVVFKLYGERAEAERAVRAQNACLGWLPTPALLGAEPDAGLTAQLAVPGRPLGRADAAAIAERAGRAVRRLHEAPLGELVPHGPEDLVRLCRAAGGRVAIALPELELRIARALDLLQATRPVGGACCPSHGDYTVGQMIEDDGRLWVVDTDTLCAAPAAHDLASFAANLVSGRAGDHSDACDALQRILIGYGAPPPGLDWHLAAAVMRRIDRPLRRLKKRWPERSERILASVEELLRR